MVGWSVGWGCSCELRNNKPPYIQPLAPKAANAPFIMRLRSKNSLLCLVFSLPCRRSAALAGLIFNLTISYYVF